MCDRYDMYDMLGNVWEWTATQYRDPGRVKADSESRFLVKGGSFLDSPTGHANHLARVSARRPLAPDTTLYNVGFRCALSKDTAKALGVQRIPQRLEL